MNAIEVNALSRQFGGLTAVDGISFSVPSGEIFGFLGPNGAGKTTTLKMLCTLLRPTSGQARVNGFDVVTGRGAVRRSIGMIFQDPSLDDRLTAEENLLFHAMIYKVPPGVRSERIRQALQLVELTDKASLLVRHFSGGMKRRLEIARGLLHTPQILFLDEPTVGLDPQTRRKMWGFLKTLHQQQGITLFLTTHYMEEAEVCNRIAIIDRGRIVALDSPEALKRQTSKDVLEFYTPQPASLAEELRTLYPRAVTTADAERVTLEADQGDRLIVELIPRIQNPLTRIEVRKPTLEDVFIHLTGRAIREDESDERDAMRTVVRRRQGNF